MENKDTNYWQNLKSAFNKFLSCEITDKRNRNGYVSSVDLLIEYAITKGKTEYSLEVGSPFFESEKSKGYKGETTLGRRRATIWHLNQYLYDHVMQDVTILAGQGHLHEKNEDGFLGAYDQTAGTGVRASERVS